MTKVIVGRLRPYVWVADPHAVDQVLFLQTRTMGRVVVFLSFGVGMVIIGYLLFIVYSLLFIICYFFVFDVRWPGLSEMEHAFTKSRQFRPSRPFGPAGCG